MGQQRQRLRRGLPALGQRGGTVALGESRPVLAGTSGTWAYAGVGSPSSSQRARPGVASSRPDWRRGPPRQRHGRRRRPRPRVGRPTRRPRRTTKSSTTAPRRPRSSSSNSTYSASARNRSAYGRPASMRARRSPSVRSRHVPGYAPVPSITVRSGRRRTDLRSSAETLVQPVVILQSLQGGLIQRRALGLADDPRHPNRARGRAGRRAARARTRAASAVGRGPRSVPRTAPSGDRANNQATSAVRRLPRCSGPVGEGANRPSWGTGRCGH